MDLKSNHTAPVLTDPAPINKSRLGVHSSMLPYSRTAATAYSAGLFLTIPRKKTGILDDVRSSSWLDAMKSSSPPHKIKTKDVNNDYALSDADVAYNTWLVFFITSLFFWIVSFENFLFMHFSAPISTLQVKYPSAIASFEQIANHAKGKRIALFLDYDGTLSPIVDNPDCAFMSDAVRISSHS